MIQEQTVYVCVWGGKQITTSIRLFTEQLGNVVHRGASGEQGKGGETWQRSYNSRLLPIISRSRRCNLRRTRGHVTRCAAAGGEHYNDVSDTEAQPAQGVKCLLRANNFSSLGDKSSNCWFRVGKAEMQTDCSESDSLITVINYRCKTTHSKLC